MTDVFGQPPQSPEQVGPFDAGVMLKITGTAVVFAPVAGEPHGLGMGGVGILHFRIECGEFAERLSGQKLFAHDDSSRRFTACMMADRISSGSPSASVSTVRWA